MKIKAILSLLAIFMAFSSSGQFNSKIDSLEMVLTTDITDSNRVDVLNRLGQSYDNTGNFAKAIECQEKAITLAGKINYKLGEALAFRNIGIIYTDMGNMQDAGDNLQQAINIFEELGDPRGIASCNVNLGTVYARQGKYPEAVDKYLRALKVNEELGNRLAMAKSYNNIGIISCYQGNFTEALQNFTSSLKIMEELGDKFGMADCYNNIGSIYLQLGDFEKAIQTAKSGLELREEIGDRQRVADSYSNIGEIYSIQGNYEEALNNFLIALKIREEIGDNRGMASSYSHLGVVYYNLMATGISSDSNQVYEEAVYNLNKGLQLAIETGSKENIKYSYAMLSNIDSLQGNYARALEYYKLYTVYKDSLVNEGSSNQIAELKIQYESEKKDREIEILNKDNEIKSLEIQQQSSSLLASKLEIENKQKEILLLNKSNEINELQLAKTQEDMEHQRMEASVREAKLELVTKDQELKGQQLEKQKLIRNGLIIGMAFLLLTGLLLFRGWQLRKKLEKQSGIIQERKRISADLHDDIGSGLSKISLLSEVVKQEARTAGAKKEAEKIAVTSRELLDSIREIIWALNANNDYLENLVSYIRRYSSEYFENSSINLKMEEPVEFPDKPINAECRRNIFYSVKEVLHNIEKHAEASEASMEFSLEKGLFSIAVHDNGKGIPDGEPNRFGNGIKNIRNRMEAIKGRVVIENHSGTKVTLLLPV